MPIIFKPGHKYLLRQTYTVAISGAILTGSLVGAVVYAGYKGSAKVQMPGKASGEATLLCFVQALVGMRVVVELRQDSIARGILDTVDDGMNLTMASVTLQPLQGTAQQLELLYIKGRQIRYIHLPGSLEASGVIERHKARIREEGRMNARDAAEAAASRKLQAGQPVHDDEMMN